MKTEHQRKAWISFLAFFTMAGMLNAQVRVAKEEHIDLLKSPSNASVVDDQVLIGTTVPDGVSRLLVTSGTTSSRAVTGLTTGVSASGVYGTADNTGAATNYGGQFNANATQGVGVSGLSLGINGRGVYGIANHASAVTNYGGYFWANGSQGRGVYSEAIGTTGVGVYGFANNSSGTFNYGGYFIANGTNGRGVNGEASGTSGIGVRGWVSGSAGLGVSGTATGTSGIGVHGIADNPSATFNYGGHFYANGSQGRGVHAESVGVSGRAVSGVANNAAAAVHYGGFFEANGASARAVYGIASNTVATNYGGYFIAKGDQAYGVYGFADNSSVTFNYGGFFASNAIAGTGVYGAAFGSSGYGVRGTADGSFATGIYGSSANGWAGLFQGKVEIQGPLTIGSFNRFESASSNLLTLSASLIPKTDNIYDLGSFAFRWDDVYATNGVIQTSDAREKSKIMDLKYGLDDVLKMRPVQFYWKHQDGSPLKLGLIAQELQSIVPEVVRNPDPTNNTGTKTGNEIDPLGIYYSDLIPVLIKAIQELEARVRELEGMID